MGLLEDAINQLRTSRVFHYWSGYKQLKALKLVEYLKISNPAAFDKALQNIVSGKDFHGSFKSAYGVSIVSYWSAFIASVAAIMLLAEEGKLAVTDNIDVPFLTTQHKASRSP